MVVSCACGGRALPEPRGRGRARACMRVGLSMARPGQLARAHEGLLSVCTVPRALGGALSTEHGRALLRAPVLPIARAFVINVYCQCNASCTRASRSSGTLSESCSLSLCTSCSHSSLGTLLCAVAPFGVAAWAPANQVRMLAHTQCQRCIQHTHAGRTLVLPAPRQWRLCERAGSVLPASMACKCKPGVHRALATLFSAPGVRCAIPFARCIIVPSACKLATRSVAGHPRPQVPAHVHLRALCSPAQEPRAGGEQDILCIHCSQPEQPA